MNNTITPGKIRQSNRLQIYHLIYNRRLITQQEICYELHLSRPTVAANLSSLENDGLIKKTGRIDADQVGRKAIAYSIHADYRIAVGTEILPDQIRLHAINLYGETLLHISSEITYQNNGEYYREVCNRIKDFLFSLKADKKQVLGIGIAMQAKIAPDGQSVLYGKLLGNTGLRTEVFSKHLSWPCRFFHEASCAAASELWASPELENALYLSLSSHLGAALISNRVILSGKHGYNSSIEHIQSRTGTKTCYCGRQGCLETLCSVSSLLQDGESLQDFFDHVRLKDTSAEVRWRDYLFHLASAIEQLHLVFDTDFILGGDLAPFFTGEDIQILYNNIKVSTPYKEDRDFISFSKMPENRVSAGAATPYIWDFLGNREL